MNRTAWTSIFIIALCGLVLTTGWAAKTPKTPKTPQEIANYKRNHPEAAQRPTPSRPNPVSAVPYTRPGAHTPGGQVNRPPSNTTPQSRPDRPSNGGGQRIDDDHSNWNYPPRRPGEPDRAYPDRRWDGRNDNHGRNDHDGRNDNHGRHDNNGGYCGPNYPLPVYIPELPVYVPGPRYIPAPRPRYGEGYAYYPQSYGPWNMPDCGDIARIPLLGCEIIAADGTFLGVIDRAYNSPESIANRDSAYGSPYSRLSIWNPEGPYGSPDGPYSPWNRNSYRPPVLYWHGEFRGYLSINPDMQPKVSPALLPDHIKASPWR